MKVKKVLLVFLSILFFGVSSFVLASCGLISSEVPTVEPTVETTEEPHIHEWDEGKITKKATCITNGEKTYKCSGCEEIKVDVITATGHDYKERVIEPTCTEKGYTRHTCENCYDSYVDSYVDVIEHPIIIDEAVEPTCTESGLTEGKHCSMCKKIFVEQKEIPAGHKFVDYVCKKCGYNYYTESLTFRGGDTEYAVSVQTVTGYDHVVIPSIYNGKPVTRIIFKDNCQKPRFKSITIPSSIKEIESDAFKDCFLLKSITIPNSVTSIEAYAFFNCSSLTSVTIETTEISISEDAFVGCYSLAFNTYENGNYLGNEANPYLFLMGIKSSITTLNVNPKTQVINKAALKDCDTLESVTIPDSVIRINESAFKRCKSLTSVTIGNGVEKIGNSAFAGCVSLKTINIPNSVTSIGNGVFAGCESIKYNLYKECLYLGNKENPYLVLVYSGPLPYRFRIINEHTKFILDGAFSGCNLSTLYYKGTEEQWNNIIGSTELSNIAIVYNYVEE